MGATPAKPAYAVGDLVFYTDRHGRPQRGTVRRIEASWSGWSQDEEPLVVYSLWHPSYHDNHCYAAASAVYGRVPAQEPAHDI